MESTINSLIENINTYSVLPKLKWIKLVSVRDALNAILEINGGKLNDDVTAYGWTIHPKNGMTIFNKNQIVHNVERQINITYIHENNQISITFQNAVIGVSFHITAANGIVRTSTDISCNY